MVKSMNATNAWAAIAVNLCVTDDCLRATSLVSELQAAAVLMVPLSPINYDPRSAEVDTMPEVRSNETAAPSTCSTTVPKHSIMMHIQIEVLIITAVPYESLSTSP